MFFLEPIHDAALLEQVVSRANRMGASGPVIVEQIMVWQEGEAAGSDDGGGGGGSGGSISTTATTGRSGGSGGGSGSQICDHCYVTFDSHSEANACTSYLCLHAPHKQSTSETRRLSCMMPTPPPLLPWPAMSPAGRPPHAHLLA